MMAPTKGPAPDLDVRAAEVPAPDAGAAATHKLSEVEEELLLLCAAS